MSRATGAVLLGLGLLGCDGTDGPAGKSAVEDTADGSGDPQGSDGTDGGADGGDGSDGTDGGAGSDGSDGTDGESCPERPVLAVWEASVEPDYAVSCAGRRCTVAVPPDAGWAEHLDAADRLFSRVPGTSDTLHIIDQEAVHRVPVGQFVVDLHLQDCGAWVLTTEALLFVDGELQVRASAPLPESEHFPTSVWGTATEALVTLGDQTLHWSDADGWTVFQEDRGRGKLTTVSETLLVESSGVYAYAWELPEGDLDAAVVTELYGSDDNMDWARACAEADTYWVTSSTGASGRCTVGGGCEIVHGAYVQGRAGVCEGDRLGVFSSGAIRWFSGADDHEDEPVPGLTTLCGSAERTWVFVEPT